MRRSRLPAAFLLRPAAHVALAALILLGMDGILLRSDHQSSRLLPYTLAAILGLSLLLAASSKRVPLEQRGRADRLWASLDRYAFVWIAFFMALLMVFHGAFTRAAGDGRAYFVHLHAMFIAHDFNMAREEQAFGALNPAIFPLGSAILWLPFYALAHVWLLALNTFGGGFRRDGYFYPYQIAVGLGSLTYGFAGLALIYRVACDYFTRWLSLAATLVLAIGSFIVWYLVVDSSYSHANSLFAVTLFLFIWHRTRMNRSRASWGWLGAIGALMVMVRWQNAVFLAPAALDCVRIGWRAARRIDAATVRAIEGPALAAGTFVVGFLPQMYFWKVVNGGWLTMPYGQTGQQWWRDSVMMDVLFSPNHGLLAWQPVIYLAVLGAPLFLVRDRYLGSILAGLFAAQVYVNGAVATWWGGTAYGGRRFDGCAMFFVLGLAALIQWCRKRPAVLWAGVLGVLLLGNVFFMQDVYSGRLPMGEGISVSQMLGATTRRLGNPFSLPASALLAWVSGATPAAYDRFGLHLYNVARIDVGDENDDQFLAAGWSERERQGDVTFRWAEGLTSTVVVGLRGNVFLQPGQPQQLSDYTLRVRVAPFVIPGSSPQGLGVEVNGRPVSRRSLNPGFQEYEFAVPHQLLKRSLNVLTFRYDYARSPRDLRIGNDSRQLSVRFDYIHFIPGPAP